MNTCLRSIVVMITVLVLSACNLSEPPTATTAPVVPTAVKIDLVIIKKVAFPADRETDFALVQLDGSYTVHFNEAECMTDDKPYMYGPYNSVRHCPILESEILQQIINDQAWLDKKLTPYLQYLNCIKGWVYLGKDEKGQERWFMEGFGFPAFCSGS